MKPVTKKLLIINLMTVSLLMVSCGAIDQSKEADEEEKEETISEVTDYGDLNASELEVRAYEGDSQAMVCLGQAYEYGTNGVSQDFDMAASWYEKAADANEPSSYLALGYFYLNGIVYDQDLDKANDYFALADENKIVEAKVGLARVLMAENGLDKATNPDEAVSSEATDHDKDADSSDDATVELTDEEQIFELLSTANRQGSLDGSYWLGFAFENGIGTEVNYAKAMDRYIHCISANNNDIKLSFARNESNVALGIMFLKGLGVDVDNEVALEYFTTASDNGYPKGSYYVGQMYENGIGMKKDYEKALEYYMLACDKEFAPAYNQVGYMYFYGRGVDTDYASAVYYQKLASLQGYAPSQVNLGYMYENGYGVEQDYATALNYYSQAAFQNYPGALEACQRVKVQIDDEASVEEE